MGSSMASSVPTAVEEVSEEGLPIITLEEVKNHFSLQDAWMVVYDRVYNVTSFLAEVCNNWNEKVYFNIKYTYDLGLQVALEYNF